jgi:hypothetical protein
MKGRASPSGPIAIFIVKTSVIIPAIPPAGPPVTLTISAEGAEPGDVVIPSADFPPDLTFLGLPVVTAPNVLTARVINITGAGSAGVTLPVNVLVASTRALS